MFSTRSPNRGNVGLAKQELARVMAVPNPYFAHSTYEVDQFNRVIKLVVGSASYPATSCIVTSAAMQNLN